MRSSADPISVVIPTRHRNDTLCRCLEALRPEVQTFGAENYEVIVTDDGSASTAEAMIRDKFPFVQWYQGPREGRSANRNFGASKAIFPFIAFVDDDCIPDPDWLDGFSKAVQPGVFVYEGKTVCREGLTSVLYEAPINLTGGSLWSCNMMIATCQFLEIGGFDVAFSGYGLEDTDLRLRLQAREIIIPFVEHAIVDHPPRPRMNGKALGASLEATVHLWYKSGRKAPMGLRMLRMLFSVNTRVILRYPLCVGTMTSFLQLGVAALYVLRRYPGWERYYREKYADAIPPYTTFELW